MLLICREIKKIFGCHRSAGRPQLARCRASSTASGCIHSRHVDGREADRDLVPLGPFDGFPQTSDDSVAGARLGFNAGGWLFHRVNNNSISLRSSEARNSTSASRSSLVSPPDALRTNEGVSTTVVDFASAPGKDPGSESSPSERIGPRSVPTLANQAER